MKKFMTVIIFVLFMFGASYGEELYTIKDVREEMRAMKKEFRAEINTLEKEIQQKYNRKENLTWLIYTKCPGMSLYCLRE